MNRRCCCLVSLSVFKQPHMNTHEHTQTDKQSLWHMSRDSTIKKEEVPQLCSILLWKACCHFAYQDYRLIATHSQLPKDCLPLSKKVQHRAASILIRTQSTTGKSVQFSKSLQVWSFMPVLLQYCAHGIESAHLLTVLFQHCLLANSPIKI